MDSLKNTIPTLLSQLHRITNIQLIQGDFNLHCSYWDKETNENPSLAWSLIQALHDHQLSLVNDESTPTFYCNNHRSSVLDLIWINDNVFSWNGAQLLYDIIGPNTDHKTLTLRIGSNGAAELQHDDLVHQYIPAGSEEGEHFIFFLFEERQFWTAADPAIRAEQFIDSCHNAWDHFSKPGLAQYNRWWNENCWLAKFEFETSPSNATRNAFLAQCKAAKKAYFAKKVEEMVKIRKPWEGTGWIKQHALPKVPQIIDNSKVLYDLDQMFEKMHDQFAQSASMPAVSGFIDELPQQPVRSWPPFSSLELSEALLTCSNASMPGPSHLSGNIISSFSKIMNFSSSFGLG